MSRSDGGAAGKLILGSRGSDLALAQATLVETALRLAHPGLEVELRVIRTSGDETAATAPFDPKAGRKGMFTIEIERALAGGEIDVAVHSAKDLPSEPAPGLSLCAVLERAKVEDLLLTRQRCDYASLAPGAVIGTGSIRRRRQLLWKRPDLQVVDLRGNVPTRLRKFAAGDWAGIILACAGIERLGFQLARAGFEFEGKLFHAASLSLRHFVPAGGQGVVALQTRTPDTRASDLAKAISHAPTMVCLRVEREFLRLLQGDCDSPVGVLATVADGVLRMHAQVFYDSNPAPREATVEASADEAAEPIAARLMENLHGG